MVQEKYGVRLATQEKGRLRKMIQAGRSSAQAITRARILIKIDEGWTAPQVATALDVSERTVFRTKRRYAEEGLDEVLRHHNQVNRPRKVDERVEAHLIALACSPVPDGHDHWTMRALAGKVVELGLVESLSPETVRLRLKKTRSSRGSRNNGASPRYWKFVAAMEDVLSLRRALRRPICLTVNRRHLGGRGVRTTPGRAMFVTCEPRRGWRHVAITRQRTRGTQQMRWLVDEAYPDVVIRLDLDNLNP